MQAALELRQFLEDALDAMLRRDVGCGKQVRACAELLRTEADRRGDPRLSVSADQVARASSWEDRDAAIRDALGSVKTLVERLQGDNSQAPGEHT